jgi:predicted O-methyltransferase YrrM
VLLDKLTRPFATTHRLKRDLKQAKRLSALLLQTQLADALAARILVRHTRDFEPLRAFMDSGVLPKTAIVQKTTSTLAFYRKLILAHDLRPRRVLEIGVKGGGSLALWAALFPEAQVIGLDLAPPRGPLPDRVTVVAGDQADRAALAALAAEHGPLDLVIDDGSHVSDHQRASFAVLADRMAPGLYVVEDIHAVYKPPADGSGYGEDIWGDFVRAAFCRFQSGPYQELPVHPELAPLLPRIADLLLAPRAFAMQIVPHKPERAAGKR